MREIRRAPGQILILGPLFFPKGTNGEQIPVKTWVKPFLYQYL